MSKLKIAIQKSGRLSEKLIALLEECGLKLPNWAGKLITESSIFPVESLFLRNDDIPQYVEQNVPHIGIIGENLFLECKKKITIVEKLNFSAYSLSLEVHSSKNWSGCGKFLHQSTVQERNQ